MKVQPQISIVRRTVMRGLTLIEVVLCIALLATVCAALASWIALCAAAQASFHNNVLPVKGMEALLDQIDRDLLVGSWQGHPHKRVQVVGDRLTIQTRQPARGLGIGRASAEVVHTYSFDSNTRVIRRQADGPGTVNDPVVVTGGVSEWEVSMQVTDDAQRMLELRARLQTGRVVQMRWRVE